MVFLRGQSLNYRRQVAFAERLGPLTLGHPTLASPPSGSKHPAHMPLVGNADPAQRTCGNAPWRDMPRFRSRDAAVPQPEVRSARDTGTGFLNRSSTGQCSSTAVASWA